MKSQGGRRTVKEQFVIPAPNVEQKRCKGGSLRRRSRVDQRHRPIGGDEGHIGVANPGMRWGLRLRQAGRSNPERRVRRRDTAVTEVWDANSLQVPSNIGCELAGGDDP